MSEESPRTGMAQSLLREIARALAALAETGACDAIDLRSLPLTGGDRADLETALGRGEVAATFDASGQSEVWETRHAGVWWVRHLGGDGRVAAETIEITPIPDILAAHPDDIRASAAALMAELAETTEETAHV
ncbi:MAG: hydrogenase expression/formation protein [Rhodobacteraceae bacterium]|nr:hydrogenase expression/formation protein [Paracoccaceae bacterium]